MSDVYFMDTFEDKEQSAERHIIDMSIIDFENIVEQNNLSTIQLESLVEEITSHFKIQGYNFQIKDLFLKLDRILFFKENIGLYKISTHLLFLIDTSFPGLIQNNEYITITLLICCMITQKYFVDEPITNSAVSRYFSVRLDVLNNYEFWILQKMDFTVPFRLERNSWTK